MIPEGVLEAVLRPHLAVGLAVGGATALAAMVVRPLRKDWGLLVVGAALVGLMLRGRLPLPVPDGLGLLALLAAGLVASAALAATGHNAPWQRGVAPLLAISVAGAFLTVPEVASALVLLGAIAVVAGPALIAGWSLRTPGAVLLGALFAWVVVAGGLARPGAIIGGLACLGVLAVQPLWRTLVQPPITPARRGGAGILVLGHIAAVLMASRVAGMRTSALEALPWALVALGIATVAVIGAEWLSQGRTRATLSRTPPSGGRTGGEQRDQPHHR